MKGFKLEDKMLKISVDVSELSAQQIRLIKSLNTLIAHLAVTEDESDYFETCAELMKQIAAFVKQANFNDFKPYDHISYAEQALEYSIDEISNNIHDPKLNTYDN